jgi:hypothetical protein
VFDMDKFVSGLSFPCQVRFDYSFNGHWESYHYVERKCMWRKLNNRQEFDEEIAHLRSFCFSVKCALPG